VNQSSAPYEMSNTTYTDLVNQTFNFPQEGFDVKNGYLEFNGVDLKALIDKYGTPMKVSYLPKIGMQIKKAKICLRQPLKDIAMKANIFIATVPKAVIFPLW